MSKLKIIGIAAHLATETAIQRILSKEDTAEIVIVPPSKENSCCVQPPMKQIQIPLFPHRAGFICKGVHNYERIVERDEETGMDKVKWVCQCGRPL